MGLAWLAVWVPVYLKYWGWDTFLLWCDISVVVACAGLWRGSALLLSTQALATPTAGLLWGLDAAWRLLFGAHLTGGTEYMWDARYPLWVRLISLFHILLPVLLLWTVGRVGYDRRALAVQTGIAGALLIASRLAGPQRNLNFAFLDPLLHRSWGPAPLHLVVILSVLVIVLYWPTHAVLARVFPPPARPS